MLNLNGNHIQLTRGDTATLSISITDDNNNSLYNIEPEDTITLSISYKPGDEPILTKIATYDTFVFNPEDTKKLGFRKFYYDIQLTKFNGEIYTIIPPSIFEICEEVTI